MISDWEVYEQLLPLLLAHTFLIERNFIFTFLAIIRGNFMMSYLSCYLHESESDL